MRTGKKPSVGGDTGRNEIEGNPTARPRVGMPPAARYEPARSGTVSAGNGLGASKEPPSSDAVSALGFEEVLIVGSRCGSN